MNEIFITRLAKAMSELHIREIYKAIFRQRNQKKSQEPSRRTCKIHTPHDIATKTRQEGIPISCPKEDIPLPYRELARRTRGMLLVSPRGDQRSQKRKGLFAHSVQPLPREGIPEVADESCLSNPIAGLHFSAPSVTHRRCSRLHCNSCACFSLSFFFLSLLSSTTRRKGASYENYPAHDEQGTGVRETSSNESEGDDVGRVKWG